MRILPSPPSAAPAPPRAATDRAAALAAPAPPGAPDRPRSSDPASVLRPEPEVPTAATDATASAALLP